MKWSEIKERWKKACTTDNVIDFSVDVGLIAFDVLSSPILIVVWVIRFYFKNYVTSFINKSKLCPKSEANTATINQTIHSPSISVS